MFRSLLAPRRWRVGISATAAAAGTLLLASSNAIEPRRVFAQSAAAASTATAVAAVPSPAAAATVPPSAAQRANEWTQAAAAASAAALSAPPAAFPASASCCGGGVAMLNASEAPASADPLPHPEEYTMSDKQRERCEQWKYKAIHQSRKVNYMMRAMSRAGCTIDPQQFIQCIACAPQASGAVMHKENGDMELYMCGNDRLRDFDHFETVLTHELIHAFDQCRAELDLSDLRHHACTEVRAANLSGDCSFMRELKMVGNLDINAHQPRCVRRKAFLSLLSNPSCETVEQAKAAIDDVFDRCMADTEPFGSVPW